MKTLKEANEFLLSLCGTKFNFLIAGGACSSELRGEKIKDFDVFCGSEEFTLFDKFFIYNAKLIEERKASKVYELEDGTQFDLVHSSHPYNAVCCFDLLHTCLYYRDEVIKEARVGALDANMHQKLILNDDKTIDRTMLRIRRFIQGKGFSIEPQEMHLAVEAFLAARRSNDQGDYVALELPKKEFFSTF